MPIYRGKLKPQDEEKIIRNFTYLIEQIIDGSYLTEFLFEKSVITQDDREAIETKATGKERSKALVDQILKSGPGDSYSIFISVLKEQGYEHVASKLEDEKRVVEPDEDKPLLSDEILDKVITESSASKIAFQLGAGWEHLIIQLGISNLKINQEKKKPNTETVTITNLIIKWRQCKGINATWRNFFRILNEIDDIEADLQKLENIATQQGS